jgi:PmbA protein
MEKLISMLEKHYKDFEIWQEIKEVLTYEYNKDGLKNEFISKEEVAVRVFENGKIGFGYTCTKDDYDSLISNINLSLEFAETDADFVMPEPQFEKDQMLGEEKDIDLVALKQKNMKIKDIAVSKPFLKDIERITTSCEKKKVFFYNSRKGSQIQNVIKYAAGIVLVVNKDDDEKMEWDFSISDSLDLINPLEIVENAHLRALKLLNSSPTHSGEYLFLFEPRASADFLEVFAQSFVGENVYKKKSLFSQELVFSDKLTIIDDPLNERGSVKSYFDGEGFRTERKILMEKGKVKDFLYDNVYGKKLGAKSNGSSIRTKVSMPPKNWFSNVMIDRGKDNVKEHLKGKKVIGVVSLLGMHLVNPITGEFSVGFDGYILEDGNFVKSLSGVSVSGNLKDFYKNIIAVDSDLKIYGQSGSPTILVGPLMLSGI